MRPRRLFAAAALAVAPLLAAAPALGAPSDTLAQVKARGDFEVARRLRTLNDLTAVVSGAAHLTPADRSSLLAQIGSDQRGLRALQAKFDADTDVATERADVRQIVTGFRVYLLLEPQVRLVRAADALTDAAQRLTAVASNLQSQVNAAQASGKDVAAAQRAVTDIGTQVTAANSTLNGVQVSLVALTPQGYPGNKPSLVQARQAILTAHSDLVTARQDAGRAVDDLRR